MSGSRLTRRRQANVIGGRSRRYQVAVSVEVDEVLQGLAVAQGKTVPRVLVDAAMNRGGDDRDLLESVESVRRLLASIANNVNQIARRVHSTGEVDAGALEAWAAYASRQVVRVDDLVERLWA